MTPERRLSGIERDLYRKALSRFVAEHLKKQPVYRAMKWTPPLGGDTVSSNGVYTNFVQRPGDPYYACDDNGERAKAWLDGHTHRRFKLLRLEDVHGVSGEGVVAEGVQFSDGKIAIHWITGDYRTTVPHDDISSVEHIHGHDGRTHVVWVD